MTGRQALAQAGDKLRYSGSANHVAAIYRAMRLVAPSPPEGEGK